MQNAIQRLRITIGLLCCLLAVATRGETSATIDIDVDKLRAHPHQEATHRGFRQYWEEYPRKGYAPSL